jgi:hypothetical protein
MHAVQKLECPRISAYLQNACNLNILGSCASSPDTQQISNFQAWYVLGLQHAPINIGSTTNTSRKARAVDIFIRIT